MTKVYQNDKDPWTGKNRGDNQGPPELDELFRKLNRKFRGSFGKGGGPGGSNMPSGGFWGIAVFIIVILIAIWALAGIYKVEPPEKGVVLKFGRYETTVGPGLHWIPRFIKTVNIVNVKHVYQFSYQAEMLTQDKNIVSAKLTVQYRIGNAKDYLFNVVKPQTSLQQATKSALRQVVGHTQLKTILTTGREAVRNKTKDQLVKTLEKYKTGLTIADVTLQEANPPKEVIDAFDDAIKAREDAVRFVNKAEAYRSKVVPDAKGKAARIKEEAQAYKQRTILQAQGDVKPFNALVKVYDKAPFVTRYRLYMEALEKALQNSRKVIMDSKEAKPMFYLPLPGKNTGIKPMAATGHDSTSADSNNSTASDAKTQTSSARPEGRPTTRPSYASGGQG